MNIKNICKILGTTTAMLSVLVLAGLVNSAPVQAAENDISTNSEVTTSSAVSINENKKNDYTIDVNASVEKDGFKLTIKDIKAAKHSIEVEAVIESDKLKNFDERDSYDNIIQMTVKNSDCMSHGSNVKKIDNNKIVYSFKLNSYKGFGDNVQLRFDVLLGKHDLNAWVETNVNISKYFDKSLQKDVSFNFGDMNFYKAESDVLGTSVYYKENSKNEYSERENGTWDSMSKILLKCNDKYYEMKNRESFIDDEDRKITGYYKTNAVDVDDLNSCNEASIIPVKCNITEAERDNIINSDRSINKGIESEESNVKYDKEFEFSDNSKAVVSKVERTDDKVKFFISSENDKNNLLMALAMNGDYDYKDDDYNYYDDSNKVIYKNPDDENGYIVEFNNVLKGKKFILSTSNYSLSYSDKFEIGKEIKVK